MALNLQAVAQIPVPEGKINLNTGTLAPTPYPVQARAAELREMMTSNPSNWCWRETPGLIQGARGGLAEFLRCRSDELLLLPNVTFALNVIVSSLTLPKGAEILLTDHLYGAIHCLWERWAAVRDWNLRILPIQMHSGLTQEELEEQITGALTPATRVLYLDHCSSPSGLVFPVKALCAAARERGILTIVDGAHAPGMLPLNLSEIGADFYAANTHKWMMGPATAGFLHAARPRRLDLRPLITSWGWNYNRSEAFEDSGNGGSKWQWDLEFHGTADRIPQMAIPAALAFRQTLGSEADILDHLQGLSAYAREKIPLPGLTPTDKRLQGGLTLFRLPAVEDGLKLRDRLYHEFHIEASITSLQNKPHLRIATATFNTRGDIDALAAAIKEIFPLSSL